MIPISKPWIGAEEADAARRVLESGWITQGREVEAFEKEFAASVGAPFACAVSSCTTALHLALIAAGVGEGDEVITVSHSFIATANSIRYCRATPVFVDIDRRTFNIDPSAIERAITPRTRAILAVHQIGMPCEMRRITEFAAAHNLPVIEDAACASGSELLWKNSWETIGKPHGDAACFSFHPRKMLTTGDGGMITTANPEWNELFRKLRQHGMSVPDTVRHGAKEVIFESYHDLGYNYRMTDLQAAVGREQLKRMPEILKMRREQAERYVRLLGETQQIILPHQPEWARSNWQSFCVILPDHDQRTVMQKLLDREIATRRAVMCVHREPAYSGPAASLPESEYVQDHGILLPLYHTLTVAEQERVAGALREAL